MPTKFSQVQTALQNTAWNQAQTPLNNIKALLDTRHSLFLRQIASSLVASVCATTLGTPLGAVSGYLLARHSFLFENIDTWYFLTPEDLPCINSGFCASLLEKIEHANSLVELNQSLKKIELAIQQEIDAFNSTTSNVLAPLGAGLGYWIGGQVLTHNLITHQWLGKEVFIKATSTGVLSTLGIGTGFAAAGVEVQLEEIEGLRR